MNRTLPDGDPTLAMPPALSVLPGPVRIADDVRAAFALPPISHRSARFVAELRATQAALCRLVNAGHTALFVGTGTLANDVVAAQLSLIGAPGLVVVTGEFGARLTDHARRFGLAFDEVHAPWGEPAPTDAIRRALDAGDGARWLWAVHCETSTGTLNDLAALERIATDYDLRLCVDAVSSIGTVPVDLSSVYLATGVSGKGLASFAGLAMVFFHHTVTPAATLPRTLDLGVYAQAEGVPYTTSSNLLLALACSLERFATPERAAGVFESRRRLAPWLRHALESRGLTVMAPEAVASPVVFTIELPPEVCSMQMGDYLASSGFLVSYQSAYLVERNLIQICLMGDLTREDLRSLLDRLSEYAGRG